MLRPDTILNDSDWVVIYRMRSGGAWRFAAQFDTRDEAGEYLQSCTQPRSEYEYRIAERTLNVCLR
jgi:hypothetical protein